MGSFRNESGFASSLFELWIRQKKIDDFTDLRCKKSLDSLRSLGFFCWKNKFVEKKRVEEAVTEVKQNCFYIICSLPTL